jgi:hypothetical protein
MHSQMAKQRYLNSGCGSQVGGLRASMTHYHLLATHASHSSCSPKCTAIHLALAASPLPFTLDRWGLWSISVVRLPSPLNRALLYEYSGWSTSQQPPPPLRRIGLLNDQSNMRTCIYRDCFALLSLFNSTRYMEAAAYIQMVQHR